MELGSASSKIASSLEKYGKRGSLTFTETALPKNEASYNYILAPISGNSSERTNLGPKIPPPKRRAEIPIKAKKYPHKTMFTSVKRKKKPGFFERISYRT